MNIYIPNNCCDNYSTFPFLKNKDKQKSVSSLFRSDDSTPSSMSANFLFNNCDSNIKNLFFLSV